jgi:hypothetical protein
MLNPAVSFVGGKRSQLEAKRPFGRCFVGCCSRFVDKKVTAASNKVVVSFFFNIFASFFMHLNGVKKACRGRLCNGLMM